MKLSLPAGMISDVCLLILEFNIFGGSNMKTYKILLICFLLLMPDFLLEIMTIQQIRLLIDYS